MLGAVAAVVALLFATAVAAREERAMAQEVEQEAESLEGRLEARLQALDVRLARIERLLDRRTDPPS